MTMKCDPFLAVYKNYFYPRRFYHGIDHINRMIKNLNQYVNKDVLMRYQDMEDLYRAILFHDVIYAVKPIPGSSSNEIRSAEFYKEFCAGNEEKVRQPVIDMILATEHHFDGTVYDDYSVNLMLDLDIMSFTDDYPQFLETQSKIDAEFYPYFDRELVHQKRKEFLTNIYENKTLKYRVVDDAEKKTQIARFNIERLLDEWNEHYGKHSA